LAATDQMYILSLAGTEGGPATSLKSDELFRKWKTQRSVTRTD